MTDDLRDQLKRMDPMPSGVPMEPVTTESSRARLESIMSTPIVEAPKAPQRRSRWYSAVAAVAVVAVAVVGVIAVTGNDAEPSGPPLALTAPGSDGGITSMCLPFAVEYLAPMPVAFEGTVTAVEGDVVTLTVDRWFKGGDAGEVVITAPQGLEALIDGFSFDVGAQYLITATDGNVNYCGFSGLSTPEMRAAFEEAFPG